MRKLIIAAVIVTAAVCSVHWYFTRGDTFNRPVFEAVVGKIRKAGIPAGTITIFRLDDLSNPDSLRPVKPGEVFPPWSGAGEISALRGPTGDLKVVIRTRDNWHFSQGGFAYTDTPMTPEQDDDGNWFLYGLPGLDATKPDLQIDKHWWRVEHTGD